MRNNEIVLTSPPKGHREECIISGTPYPGTHMEIVPGQVDRDGRFTYRAVSRLDGAKGGICILDFDSFQGKLPTDPYVSGTRGFIYWPVAGEEMNILLRNSPGTGTVGADNVGDLLEVDGATGMVQPVGTGGATGSHVSAPWQLLEDLTTAPTGNRLVFAKYLGNNA